MACSGIEALRDLPNIGQQLAVELVASDIASLDALKAMGSLQAAIGLRDHGFHVCANKLYALEGAIRGIRWHGIPPAQRSALWSAFQAY